jgi:hypothetical protein
MSYSRNARRGQGRTGIKECRVMCSRITISLCANAGVVRSSAVEPQAR